MIDTEKMKALAAKLRGPLAKFDNFAAGYSEAADAIDLLLAEVEAAEGRALEQAARLIEPKNEPDDWTEYAKIRAEAAASIRALAQRQGEGS